MRRMCETFETSRRDCEFVFGAFEECGSLFAREGHSEVTKLHDCYSR